MLHKGTPSMVCLGSISGRGFRLWERGKDHNSLSVNVYCLAPLVVSGITSHLFLIKIKFKQLDNIQVVYKKNGNIWVNERHQATASTQVWPMC